MQRIKVLILIGAVFLISSMALSAPKAFYGKSSWYGGKFHGRKTASGEIYDKNKLTAAHRSLPFGTILKVTNLSNNLSVQVKVNDRGPFVRGRVLDLSRKAADELKFLKQGMADIKAEIMFMPDKNQRDFDFQDEVINPGMGTVKSDKAADTPKGLAANDENKDIDEIIKSLKMNLEGKDDSFDKEDGEKKEVKTSQPIKSEVVEKELTEDKPLNEQLAVIKEKAKADGKDAKGTFEQKIFQLFVIQLAAFTDKDKAQGFQQKLKDKNIESYVTQVERDNLLLFKIREKKIYRNLEEVKARVEQLRQLGIECFVIAKFFFGS